MHPNFFFADLGKKAEGFRKDGKARGFLTNITALNGLSKALKNLRRDNDIRFEMKKVDNTADKVFLLIQVYTDMTLYLFFLG